MKTLMTRQLKNTIPLFFCALSAMSCSPTSSNLVEQPISQPKVEIEFIPLAELRELVSPNHSNLDAYLLTDGAWVKDAPIFVNQEFDFGTALGLEGIGAGIASAQRQRVSKETAALLEPASKIDLNKVFLSSLKPGDQHDRLFEHYRVAVYAILFGHPKARLQSIVEFHRKVGKVDLASEKNEPLRVIRVSDELPIQGAGSWSENGARNIQKALKEGVSLLAHEIGNLFDVDGSGYPKLLLQLADEQLQRCHIGGNQYAKVLLLRESPSVFMLRDIQWTLVMCSGLDAK